MDVLRCGEACIWNLRSKSTEQRLFMYPAWGWNHAHPYCNEIPDEGGGWTLVSPECGDLCADFVLWLSKLLSHYFSAFHECWYTQHQLSWAKCEEISHILSFYHVPTFVLLLFTVLEGVIFSMLYCFKTAQLVFVFFLHTLPIKKYSLYWMFHPFAFPNQSWTFFSLTNMFLHNEIQIFVIKWVTA